jgi:ABC-type antimicrobial peptide transport system permease subunit
VNTARAVLLYCVGGLVGIVLGIVTAEVTYPCTKPCTVAIPRFAIWQSGLIGFGTAAVVLIACALLDEEFVPITRAWLRALRRRSGTQRRGEGS